MLYKDIFEILGNPDNKDVYLNTEDCVWIVSPRIELVISFHNNGRIYSVLWWSPVEWNFIKLEDILEILNEDWKNKVLFNLDLFSDPFPTLAPVAQ